MGKLSVVVSLHGVVVESRVLSVHREVCLGEAKGADISFPGAHLVVRRAGDGLLVRGRTLAEGDGLEIQLGRILVQLEHTRTGFRGVIPVPHELSGSFDGRFLLMLLFIVVGSTWIDAFEFWVADRFAPILEERAYVDAGPRPSADAGGDVESSAAVAMGRGEQRQPTTTVSDRLVDGPPHESDDHASRVRWYRWYRSEAPSDYEQLDAAVAALEVDARNADARSFLGRAAYDADRYRQAADQYGEILRMHPADPSTRLRLAHAEMRLGHHQVEIRHYGWLLESNPDDVAALAGMVVALTRLERLDEADAHLEELRVEHPDHALTHLTRAKVAALAGRDADALEHLDELMRTRTTLNAEWRLELRRDIALDPAFARLRKDIRLRGLMNRHLGAAGPRPMR